MITAKEAREMQEKKQLPKEFNDAVNSAINYHTNECTVRLSEERDQLWYEDALREMGYTVTVNRVYDATNYFISW